MTHKGAISLATLSLSVARPCVDFVHITLGDVYHRRPTTPHQGGGGRVHKYPTLTAPGL